MSYASPDAAVANAIVEYLEGHGLKCWMAPRDVKPGAQYADAIVRAINDSRYFVLVLSGSAVASAHVGREVERAASKHKAIIAFRVDTAPLSHALEYFLSESQWIDVPALGMATALAKLAEAAEQGAEAGAAVNPVAARSDSKPRRITGAAVILVLVGIAVALSVHYWSDRPQSAQSGAIGPIAEKSIAVLPFVDMSEKHDQEYFADGMAEEILDLLAKVPGLHVPARTSSFYFKGKSEDIPTIAHRLMVANVLEGSVRRAGDRVRITVQLVRADNGYHLWSETYDRTLDDVFKVQDDIAGEIVKALKVSLGEKEVPRVIATKNSDAHAFLLQARFFLARQTQDDLARAVDYYQQVVQLDPNSATGWAELSMALTYIWNSGFLPTNRTVTEQRALALQAAERAIAINPNLGEAHEAMAEVRYWFDWNWSAAEEEIEKAISIDPSAGLTQAGGMAMLYGKYNEALRLWKQEKMVDPLNTDAYFYLAELHYVLGEFEEAVRSARSAVELSPTSPGSHVTLARMLLAAGQSESAVAEIAKDASPGYRAYGFARTYAILGRRAEADAALAHLEQNFAADQLYDIATVHALRGENDQALGWLDRAYQQHDSNIIGIPQITVEPDMRNLRADPRFKAFLRKMNLPGEPAPRETQNTGARQTGS